jgi:hypothetical protein
LKYWRGYLIAAILAALSWGLMQFAKTHSALVDMIYPYVTRLVMSHMAQWSGGVDICVWQLVVAVAGVCALGSIVLMILLRWNPIQWFGWVVAAVALVFFLHTGIYGLNYYAGPLAEDVHLQMTEYTVEELEKATVHFRDQANALASQVNRDDQGNVEFAEFETLAQQAGEGFHVLTYEKGFSVFAGCDLPVKKLGWADAFSSAGISGITIGITGEAAVNPNLPDVALPFTMCHEMSHRMSIASEQDANFAAFLACRVNPSVEFQYSAYLMAYRYCINSLSSDTSAAAKAALSRITGGASQLLKTDLDYYNAQLRAQQKPAATKVATAANDTYLKTSGEEQGTASYGAVTDCLVSWYIQEYILPLYDVEVEEEFDPLDETQVDLSGIVNARPAQ